jgi:lysozyme family protein
MTDYFSPVWKKTLAVEGGYSNNADDPGGKTRWGITEGVARFAGYTKDMAELDQETAKGIAKKSYWDALKLDEVAELSPSVAAELFDTSYNCGVGTAGQMLQRSLNALNRGGSDFSDLTVDGKIGSATVAALRSYLAKRGSNGELVLLRALNSLQGSRYVQLAERNPSLETFVFGWFLNRVS